MVGPQFAATPSTYLQDSHFDEYISRKAAHFHNPDFCFQKTLLRNGCEAHLGPYWPFHAAPPHAGDRSRLRFSCGEKKTWRRVKLFCMAEFPNKHS